MKQNDRNNLSFTGELLQVLDLHAKYSIGDKDPWYTLVDSVKQTNEFEAEVHEMLDEIRDTKNDDNLVQEIGDAFWDML